MSKKWALILGASSGFGGATAVKLAQNGFSVIGVHLDRQATMQNVEKIKSEITEAGQQAWFFNINAADENKRKSVLDEVKAKFDETGDKIKVLMHSLAFGTLKQFIAKEPSERISKKQMEMTLDVMAHSLVYWTQDVYERDLFAKNSRIFAMTSSGSHEVIAAYGAVGAAKATLEAHIRQLAVELAREGITANALMAGVTDTPALRKIPGNDLIVETAMAKNPTGRLTTPEDVASAVVALSDDNAYFINGNVITVDGGEFICARKPF
jgi:NAD(P)-dependent dehydrogenase (short-subunit alcohol dehydrogenase family)